MPRFAPAAQTSRTKPGKRLSAITASAFATSAPASLGRAAHQPLVAEVDDRALAAPVDADRRDRRGDARDARAADAVDVLARRERQDRVADRVDARRPAERTREARARAEMRDRDRGIRRVAAVDGAEFARLRLHVRPREALDAEHHVEHRDAGAQHMLARVSAKTPSPSSTQARMM